MSKSRTNIDLILFHLVFTVTIKWCCCSENSSLSMSFGARCKLLERTALLNFKRSLTSFDASISSSWTGEDCCQWSRVVCDNNTGHVLELHLGNPDFGLPDVFVYDKASGPLISADNLTSPLEHLLKLKQLRHLDLSGNDFSHSIIPKSIGSMKQLRHLNLFHTPLVGLVPHELGNLTRLQYLDLSQVYSEFDSTTEQLLLRVDELNWITGLQELRLLGMDAVNMSLIHNWKEFLIEQLPSLTELHLANCGLPNMKTNSNLTAASLIQSLDLSMNNMGGTIPFFIQNFTSLETLDLHKNNFISEVPLWLGNFPYLNSLYLQSNSLTGFEGGNIWGVMQNMCGLKYVDLSDNKLQGNLLEPRQNISSVCSHFIIESLTLDRNKFLTGGIPAWLEEFKSLSILSLKATNLSGEIPTSMGQLSNLIELNLDENPGLGGSVLSEVLFTNLSNLSELSFMDTFITLEFSSDWMPPFQLQILQVSSCNINGEFPQWLRTQNSLEVLYLSNTGISGPIPKWFQSMKQIISVDLSYNNITGSPIFPINVHYFFLSDNSLNELFLNDNNNGTTSYPNLSIIDLSNNFISGQLPEDLHSRMPNLGSLILSGNQISGSITKSICQLTYLEVLDLRKNRLTGTIPHCLSNLPGLELVSLSFNKLVGDIPCFFTKKELDINNKIYYSLHLNDNIFSGEIPSCLSKVANLLILDVGGNELVGKIPTWINGENFGVLKILRLRGNKLNGSIPSQLCSLPLLQLLDLGNNHLSGTIPYCLSNLTSMNSPLDINPNDKKRIDSDNDKVNEVIQGIERAYTKNLKFLVAIDLSNNSLVGGIPVAITNLSYLLSLNLSYNRLSGPIPENIGGLKSLISLDLSRNRLSGSIPTRIGVIYPLAYLNLSYNNFSGQIPTGNQMQTLVDPSSYAGNPYLCGDPLPKKCNIYIDSSEASDQDNQDDENKAKQEKIWFSLDVIAGFATGFWAVVGTLLLNRSWRHAFFRHFESIQDCVYVFIAIRVAKLKEFLK